MSAQGKWLIAGVMVVCCGAGAAAPKEGVLEVAKWSHVAAVEVAEKPAKGMVEAELPLEVLAVAREDLGDLRLVDGAGRSVPFVLREEQGEAARQVSYRPERLFNATFVPGKEDVVTVDFGAGGGAGREMRTRIDVETPGTNFKRQVKVEASADGAAWQVLRQGAWLFRVNYEGGQFEKRDVALPENDFRYLRITLAHAADDPQRVPIQGVMAWRLVGGSAPAWVEAAIASRRMEENKALRATEIDLDLGSEQVPVGEVELAFEDANFLRRVEVMGRNVKSRVVIEPVENGQPRKREVEEPWESLGGGSVFRLPAGGGEETAGTSVRVKGRARYLLVRVFNGDDRPLTVAGAKVRRGQKFVAFRANDAGKYLLYAGNARESRPQYDLELFAEKLRADGVTAAKVGALGTNAAFAAETKVVPWSERYAWVLWLALLSGLGVLAVVVMRQAKQAQRAQ